MFNHTGRDGSKCAVKRTCGGAESGGVAQLPNGDVVAIFNQIGGGGHWQARPVNTSDPHLTHWRYTHPNGTSCGTESPCVVTPGLPGTDLSQAFLDGSNDGYWRVVADRGHGGGVTGAAMLAKTKDFLSFEVESMYHEYKWDRCVSLPSECGFGPYPRDPNTFKLIDDIWVFYGMQKTCSFSGREFYVLGTYTNNTFVPLDAHSDYANNVWDGGEGYASMHVYDPVRKRILWMTAVIEGDRDPCGDQTGDGFWRSWMVERDIGKGWFGTLGLPRVVRFENLTSHFEESTAMHLITSPLPELSALRDPTNSYALPGKETFVLSPGVTWSKRRKHGHHRSLLPRSQSSECIVQFSTKDMIKKGSDAGVRVLWDDETEEYTHVGVRDGTYLSGIDLWDQVNGDSHQFNVSGTAAAAVDLCRNACLSPPSGVLCAAWTLSNNKLCRFKAHAQHALQVASNNGAFLPYHPKSISGYIHTSSIHFLSLYIDRTHTTLAAPNNNYSYPHYNYSKLLMVVVGNVDAGASAKGKHKNQIETTIELHVFVDRSIVEVFGQGGRSVVTARVYPSKKNSNRIGVYNNAMNTAVTVEQFKVWSMKSALSKEEKEKKKNKIDPAPTISSPIQDNNYNDARDISNGIIMLEQIYTDQPYCTQFLWKNTTTPFVRWACVVTVNNYVSKNGRSEGGFGEHGKIYLVFDIVYPACCLFTNVECSSMTRYIHVQ